MSSAILIGLGCVVGAVALFAMFSRRPTPQPEEMVRLMVWSEEKQGLAPRYMGLREYEALMARLRKEREPVPALTWRPSACRNSAPDDGFDPYTDPLSPINPIGLLNPASPLYIGGHDS